MADLFFAEQTVHNSFPLDHPPRATAVIPTPTVESLFALFPATACPPVDAISPDEMPEPYRSLLVHTHHMTVTVERFYGRPVDVEVLEFRLDEFEYSRMILLRLRDTRRVVQFGIVQIDLRRLGEKVRDQIVAGKTPLGRVLIENDVLRHIQPAGYVRVAPSGQLAGWFGQPPEVTFGRLGVIFADDKPAVEVLEVLAPVPDGPAAGAAG